MKVGKNRLESDIKKLKNHFRILENDLDTFFLDSVNMPDVTRINEQKISYHAIRRYCERVLGIEDFHEGILKFIREGKTRDMEKVNDISIYTFGVYELIVSKNGLLITIIDKSVEKSYKEQNERT